MSPLAFSNDCVEFIIALNSHKVKWVIVGGEAVIYYGHIRLTGDVDFFYSNELDNRTRLWNALNDFWDHNIPGNLTENDLGELGNFIQFGVPPNRIDLMNQIDGVEFDEAWENRVVELIHINDEKIKVNYIGLNQLIKNKSVSNRPKDQEDLKYLKRKRDE
ncbi:MAG: nucleotidyltransferase [Balneolaceae bacterium]|nr:nucleotidyltransferase [Balneolaceae bacterium]MDR9408052.1 nucleotidyltransferase [Balneolaceae bacterium]